MHRLPSAQAVPQIRGDIVADIVSINIENMDLAKPSVIPVVRMMQDDRAGRQLTISLFENGQAWTPPEEITALIMYSKPDGTGGTYDSIPGITEKAWSFAENRISVAIAPQVVSVPGMVLLSVKLLFGNYQLHTFSVRIDVQKTPGINVASEDFVSLNWLPYVRTINGVSPDPNTGNITLALGEGGATISIDSSLTLSGQAADAKATGTGIQEAKTAASEAITAADSASTAASAAQIAADTATTKADAAQTAAESAQKAVNDLPITVDSSNYTDIEGLRQVTAGSVVKSGNTVTINTTLQGGVTSTVVMTLDDDEFPTSITVDGTAANWTWEGFD